MWLGALVLAPLVLLNLAVAFFGGTVVSPLSPFFLEAKVHALGAYARHRPGCLVVGHPDLEPLIDAAERRHHLPRGLLQALVEVESEKRVHRISAAGAMGPGQLMPGTARLMDVEDPFDSTQAIDGSARYLAEQLRRFDSLPLAIAAYNAGPGNVNGRVPRNGETEYYVAKVLRAYGRTRPPPERVVRPSPPPAAAPVAAVLRPAASGTAVVRPARASAALRTDTAAKRAVPARGTTPRAAPVKRAPKRRAQAAAPGKLPAR
nr:MULTISPECIES: lytic transglycosylase domain-containing protein [Myxococcaceae]